MRGHRNSCALSLHGRGRNHDQKPKAVLDRSRNFAKSAPCALLPLDPPRQCEFAGGTVRRPLAAQSRHEHTSGRAESCRSLRLRRQSFDLAKEAIQALPERNPPAALRTKDGNAQKGDFVKFRELGHSRHWITEKSTAASTPLLPLA